MGGSFRFGLPGLAAQHWIAEIIRPGFCARPMLLPDLVMHDRHHHLISDSMQACEHMMLRGDAHFLLCHYHRQMSGRIETAQFKSIVVGADTLVPLSAANKNKRPRWRLREDKTVKYLAYSLQSGLGRIIGALRAANDHRFRLETVFTSHLAATLLSMTRAGDGVAWLPRTLAEEDIAAGSIVEAGSAELHIPIEIRLFRPVARQSQTAEAAWEAFERATA